MSLNKNFVTLAELGRGYPPEFISVLADSALDTVTQYLAKSETPAELVQLVDDIVSLNRFTHDLKAGVMSDLDAVDLVETLPDILGRIKALGGVFFGPYGQTMPVNKT